MKATWLLLLIGYSALIFYLSHQPYLPIQGLFLHQDKVLHAAAYGIMAFLAINYFKYLRLGLNFVLVISFIFCALYGASDEFHQSFIEGRQADVLDWLADCFGALLLLLSFKQVQVTTERT